jgi:RimJ/RimL family protein N-acetyltransferase
MIDFDKDYILENDKVLLRELKISDVNNLLYFAENEQDIWQYSLIRPKDKTSLEEYIRLALNDRNNKKSYPFIVFDKTKNQYAGSTRFYDINSFHKSLSLGYTWYGKDFRGTQLNKNCKYLLLEFAFENIAVERVEFKADVNNIQSIRAMKSIGCVEEGILRNNFTTNSGRRDSIVLSIIKSEWYSNTKQNLLKKI